MADKKQRRWWELFGGQEVLTFVTFVAAVLLTLLVEGHGARTAEEALIVCAVGGVVLIGALVAHVLVQSSVAERSRERLMQLAEKLEASEGLREKLEADCSELTAKLHTRDSDANGAIDRIHATYGEIAEIFAATTFKQLEFESHAFGLLESILKDRREKVAEKSEVVRTHYYDLLEDFCNAVVDVISKRKGLTGRACSANIKMLLPAQSGDGTRYAVLARSSKTRYARDPVHRDTETNNYDMTKNKMYASILSEDIDSPDYYVVSDLERFLLDMEARYTEPSRNALRYWRSCIVHPIIGPVVSPDDRLPMLHSRKYVMHRRSDAILGFMCVDSIYKDVFEAGPESYEGNVMSQLSSQIFNCTRLYYTIMSHVRVSSA